MNAYEAMVSILDINETIEEIKQNNIKDEPDLLMCKTQDLLVKFREVLVAEMKKTTLEVFNDNK